MVMIFIESVCKQILMDYGELLEGYLSKVV